MNYTATVKTDKLLVFFLYQALKDGEIGINFIEEFCARQANEQRKEFVLDNGWIAGFAQNLARELTGEGGI